MVHWAEIAIVVGIGLAIGGAALERRAATLGSARMGWAILLVLGGLILIGAGALRLLLPWIFGGHVG